MLRALAAVAAVGCYHPHPSSGAPCVTDEQCPASLTCIDGRCGGSPADGGPDVSVDAPVDCASWTAHHFDACAIPPPTPDLVLTAAGSPWQLDSSAVTLLDKDNNPVVVSFVAIDQAGTSALVASVQSLTIESGATLRLIGVRPVIVASWGSIDIAGAIDAGSHRTGGRGAGGNPTVCGPDAAATGQSGAGGAGGGGGGAFRGAGGHGGQGDSDGTALKNGGAAGKVVAVPMIVRGGCSGANGGKDDGGTPLGGTGGGAIQLTARLSMRITGTINAGGAGGAAGTLTDGGGGGGGSGGYIGIESPAITLLGATLAANGGGGGEGCGTEAVKPGADGTPDATAAAGGASAACGVAGGIGGAGAKIDGAPVTLVDTCGGGGGGGGAGYILAWGPADPSSATISPALVVNPF
jgi:hypothetical protein